jgi:hypothetical protein
VGNYRNESIKRRPSVKTDPEWEGERRPKQSNIESDKKGQQRGDYERNRK